MTEIESKLYVAVMEALGIAPNITLHALVRYIERNLLLDVRHVVSRRWNYHGLKVPDSIVIRYLNKYHPEIVSVAREDIIYYTQNKYETFVNDDFKFVIEGGKVITVIDRWKQ